MILNMNVYHRAYTNIDLLFVEPQNDTHLQEQVNTIRIVFLCHVKQYGEKKELR